MKPVGFFKGLFESSRLYWDPEQQSRLLLGQRRSGSPAVLGLRMGDLESLLSVIAAGKVDPEAGHLILGMGKQGKHWLKARFPGLNFNNRETTCEGGKSFGEVLGINGYRTESGGPFELLTIEDSGGIFQILCFQGVPAGLKRFPFGAEFSFRKMGTKVVVNLFLNKWKDVNAGLDLRSIQEGGEWTEFVRIAELSRIAVGCSAKVSFFLEGGRNPTRICVRDGVLDVEGYRWMQRVLDLATLRYRPVRLVHRPVGYADPYSRWILSPQSVPAMTRGGEEVSSREVLVGKARLNEWLRAGGLSLADLDTDIGSKSRGGGLAPFTIEIQKRFERTHRQSGFSLLESDN